MITSQKKPGGDYQVTLEGPRLVAAVAEQIKSDLKALADDGAKCLEIDFRNVDMMDSSGLGALVGALKSMGPGAQIEIVNPCPAVVKVLKLTRMNKVFRVRE